MLDRSFNSAGGAMLVSHQLASSHMHAAGSVEASTHKGTAMKSHQHKRGRIHWSIKQLLWHKPCAKCGAKDVSRTRGKGMQIDHVIPISKGGTSEVSNLQALCWLCNGQKGASI
jgi:hypothetical protein